MRKLFLFLSLIGISTFCFSNNISVTNISLTGKNTTSDYTLVEFDISWDNSWRTSTLESNYDAAWVFVKWRLKNSTVWNHATFNTTGYTAPAGSTIYVPADGKGLFIYKNGNGMGTNTWTDAQARWNYGVDGVTDYDLVEVCVIAIEMVYVPSGAFLVGDGSNGIGIFHPSNLTYATPYYITSESLPATLGGNSSTYMCNNSSQTTPLTPDDFTCGGGTISLAGTYPKGFNAFYIMKYEITQEQYTDFLNKLTYTKQATRTAVLPSSAAGTGALSNTNRNGIDIMTSGVSTTVPAVYACNLDGDAIYNEAADGQNIACNHLSWADLAAYLDWSGLRPMTDLEFQKSCRGVNSAAVAIEYTWGNTTITGATGITNGGLTNEVASNAGANVVYNNAGGVPGPMRVGNFALVTNRQNSGGSYYGAMELSGNVTERTITLGNATGRSFTAVNGNGNLDASGNADAATWPGTNAIGTGYLGGSWINASTSELTVSSRYYANSVTNFRSNMHGGRGVRNE